MAILMNECGEQEFEIEKIKETDDRFEIVAKLAKNVKYLRRAIDWHKGDLQRAKEKVRSLEDHLATIEGECDGALAELNRWIREEPR